MSKRRITKQQSSRIQKIQEAYQASSQETGTAIGNYPGLVITRFSRHAEIESADKQRIHCSIRPHLETIVAGDRIIWQKTGDNQGVIVSCCPRQSVLGRPDKQGKFKPVAANITQLLIVIAPKPDISWYLLDSYLIMAELLKINTRIILNKIDLPCQTIIEELTSDYQLLGYEILQTSQENNQGYAELTACLANHTSVFVGQSGVGKSSLIAAILPHETISVSEISTRSQLGCHTTSNSKLYHLPCGGALIDSPGVRSFSLWEVTQQDIVYGFREFRTLATQCKFSNCTHINTPGCALSDAIDKQTCPSARFERLIQFLKSEGEG